MTMLALSPATCRPPCLPLCCARSATSSPARLPSRQSLPAPLPQRRRFSASPLLQLAATLRTAPRATAQPTQRTLRAARPPAPFLVATPPHPSWTKCPASRCCVPRRVRVRAPALLLMNTQATTLHRLRARAAWLEAAAASWTKPAACRVAAAPPPRATCTPRALRPTAW